MIYKIFSVLIITPIITVMYPVLGIIILCDLYFRSIKILAKHGAKGLVYTLQVLKAQIEEVTNNVD